MRKTELTPKQEHFVKEYLVDLNGLKAAVRAGYSPKSAAVTAARNLKNPTVRAAVQDAMQRRARRTEVSQDRVLQELARIAFAAPDDLQQWRKVGLAPRFADRLRALELVGRHLGMWRQNMRLEVQVQTGDKLRKALMEKFERIVEARARPIEDDGDGQPSTPPTVVRRQR